jgi:hypothetical protein
MCSSVGQCECMNATLRNPDDTKTILYPLNSYLQSRPHCESFFLPKRVTHITTSTLVFDEMQPRKAKPAQTPEESSRNASARTSAHHNGQARGRERRHVRRPRGHADQRERARARELHQEHAHNADDEARRAGRGAAAAVRDSAHETGAESDLPRRREEKR